MVNGIADWWSITFTVGFISKARWCGRWSRTSRWHSSFRSVSLSSSFNTTALHTTSFRAPSSLRRPTTIFGCGRDGDVHRGHRRTLNSDAGLDGNVQKLNFYTILKSSIVDIKAQYILADYLIVNKLISNFSNQCATQVYVYVCIISDNSLSSSLGHLRALFFVHNIWLLYHDLFMSYINVLFHNLIVIHWTK